MSKNKTFDLSTLKGYSNNPRTALTEKGREKLGKSLQKNGKFLALREIVYDPETMEILGGNKRFELLVEQGFKDVPIEWVKAAIGLTEQEKKEFVLLDNSHYETEFDYEIIQQYFSDINLDDICITIPNFEIEETPEATEDNYEIPETIKTNIVKGDLFEIGNHRLLCGDSTDSEQVAKLMNGEKADCVVTDPPYGIGLKYVGVMANNTNGEIINDDKEFDPSSIFTLNAKVYYIFGADYFLEKLPNRKGLCVWAKAHTENENLVFGASFETFWRSHKDKREIWYEKRLTHTNENLKVHASQKPTSLIERCINDAGIGGNIVDLFLGSGTTMVASHQLKRRCYGLELSENYCQVIIERMLKLDPTLIVKKNGVITNEFQ